MTSKRSLKELLAINENNIMDEDSPSQPDQEMDTDQNEEIDPSLCVECGDQPREVDCVQCDEGFCGVCFGYLHRTGKRKEHETKILQGAAPSLDSDKAISEPKPKKNLVDETVSDEEEDLETADTPDQQKQTQARQQAIARFRDNTMYIPMRLTAEERKLFRLLEAALNVSEYTDKVDVYVHSSKVKRIVSQLKEMCTVLTGLVVANGMEEGQRLVDDKEFITHADWYQTIFEIGRRYKIMNPERMRSTFGKLMYMIMDSRLPEVRETLEFDLYKPILTVHSFLEARDGLRLLDSELVFLATQEIKSEGRDRRSIQKDIRTKEQAIERLARTMQTPKLGAEDIRQVLYSIGDYHAYLGANRTPVREMIDRLQSLFAKDSHQEGFSLAISYGSGGARLSHNHAKQFQYVLQSLTLWSEIMRDMYRLWKLADDDMTDEKLKYRLADTGQGLNRVMASPSVGRAMHNIIARAQRETGSWIGSSVVHLGDRAVPNALFFLDKYLQVPRVLNPVNTVIRLLPAVVNDKFSDAWVKAQFGSVEELQKIILTDFFRHAFDGSGADNFYDAGSCIDGRLTSTWNWANTIGQKPYYKHFLITGFTGFDGSDGF